MQTQDFSPSARNDSCLSRLRLERTGVSPALQAPTPTPLPPLGRGAPRGGQLKADALPLKAARAETQDFSPPARNDRRLRLEMTVVYLAGSSSALLSARMERMR